MSYPLRTMASVLEDDCWREGDGLPICGRAAVMNRTGLIEFVQGLLGREELGARITLYQRTEKRAVSPTIRETLCNDKVKKRGQQVRLYSFTRYAADCKG